MKRFLKYAGSMWKGLLVLVSADTSKLHAEVIAADDFEYETTITRGANGGTGWADAWTGANLITVGSLRFRDYAAKGHKLTTNGGQTSPETIRCSFRTLETRDREDLIVAGRFGKPGTILWVGFLANVPTGVTAGYGGISLFDGPREQLFLGDTGGETVWGFERTGHLQGFSSIRANEETCFLVYKIAFRESDAQVEMWVNPKLGRESPPATEVAAAEVVNGFHFNRVRISSGPVPLSVDGFRIGTTYADIAPTASDTQPKK